MAVKPYLEGQAWSFRLRLKGQDIYRTGFPTEAAARRETERLRQKLRESGKPKHQGPWQTTVAQAFQDYARERLPALKGARQDAGRINRYLRLVGLDVIKLVALQSSSSGVDGGILGRWGGEEFLVLSPKTTIDEIALLSEMLRRVVESHEFGLPETITFSAGISTCAAGDSPETLLQRADKALYKAKRRGRNRVCR